MRDVLKAQIAMLQSVLSALEPIDNTDICMHCGGDGASVSPWPSDKPKPLCRWCDGSGKKRSPIDSKLYEISWVMKGLKGDTPFSRLIQAESKEKAIEGFMFQEGIVIKDMTGTCIDAILNEPPSGVAS